MQIASPETSKIKPNLAHDSLACIHRGRAIRRGLYRLASAQEKLAATIYTCRKIGECTLTFCANCELIQPREDTPSIYSASEDTIRINHGAGGLGDAILGACVLRGLEEEDDRKFSYGIHARALEFLQLFNLKSRLYTHISDQVTPELPPQYVQMNVGYEQECASRCSTPRWERYADNIFRMSGRCSDNFILPALRQPERLKSLAAAYQNCIVLAPFSTWRNREWRLESWLTLESLLLRAGYRLVIVDSLPDRIEAFHSEKLTDVTPDLLTGIVLNADCVIGNDSGIAHLAGVLGKPTIVLCGQTTGQQIYGLYPKMKYLEGRLSCAGCWWNSGPYNDERCNPTCANMQSILPEDVLAEVDRFCLGGYAENLSVIGPDKLRAVRDLVMQTNHLQGDLAEFGVYQGGTAKLIQVYSGKISAPRQRMHLIPAMEEDGITPAAPVLGMTEIPGIANLGKLRLFDTFRGMPQDDEASEGHKRGDFDDCNFGQVKQLLGDDVRVFIYPGMFPDSIIRHSELLSATYRFAHVDMDLKQSTRDVLEYLLPRMVRGGAILFDDYGWYKCPGVAAAIHEKLGEHVALERPTLHQAVLRF